MRVCGAKCGFSVVSRVAMARRALGDDMGCAFWEERKKKVFLVAVVVVVVVSYMSGEREREREVDRFCMCAQRCFCQHRFVLLCCSLRRALAF